MLNICCLVYLKFSMFHYVNVYALNRQGSMCWPANHILTPQISFLPSHDAQIFTPQTLFFLLFTPLLLLFCPFNFNFSFTYSLSSCFFLTSPFFSFPFSYFFSQMTSINASLLPEDKRVPVHRYVTPT